MSGEEGAIGFEEFCGGKFWDVNKTWYTDQPRFTRCFQLSALVWGPAAWLWITMPFYACYLASVRSLPIQWNSFNISKMVFTFLLAAVSVLDLGKGIQEYLDDPDTVPLILIVSPAIFVATFILSMVLTQAERAKGLITSGIQFLFYTILLLCGVIPFYDRILEAQDQGIGDLYRFVTFYLYYAMVIVMFLMFCMTDTLPVRELRRGKLPCPEIEASFLSRITFWWINGLVYTGFKKALEDDDLWDLNPRDLTSTTFPVFESAWNKELQGDGGSGSAQALAIEGKSSEKTPLLSQGVRSKYGEGASQVEIQDKTTKKNDPSLFRALAKVYGLSLLQAHLCKFVCDLLTFVGPTLQKLLIGYTEDPSIQQWKGYMYAALFFVSSVVNSFFFHQLFHIGMTLGMRIKAAVIAAVYKKALTMSNEARKTSTVGEIVNLMSVDAQRLQDVTGYLWMIWSAPLQIALAVYLLWDILGIAVLAGLAVMILLIPINGVMATLQRKLQIAQMSQKDQRIKLMNEVLNGIKVLKLYAWELSFKEKVNVIRDMELDTLKKYAYLSAVGTFTWTCAPFLVTLASFATFVLMGGVLDAEKAFVSLSLFNILRFPINLLPMMISYIVTASVSIKRLSSFLQNGDLDFDAVQHDQNSKDPIAIKGATFAWGTDKDDLIALKDINLEVKDGDLLAIVGQVGAGKSSLISATLGEMEKMSGTVNVRGSVALVAQQAWIQNATLKDNIVFGKEFDADKYDKVLEACALKPDLEILPGGDMTEIGEKGINLSGGQKQRVSLARAVYNDADIYLLDDPLSAVDSHVGKHIFEQVISDGGLLKGKTRLLVTHGIHWLPRVDKIVVMVNGVITETGSYDDLLGHDGDFAQFLKQYLTQEFKDSDAEEDDDEDTRKAKKAILERVASIAPSEELEGAKARMSGDDQSERSSVRRRRAGSRSSQAKTGTDTKRQSSRKMSTREEVEDIAKQINNKENEKLIKEEVSEEGQVKWSVFFSYCRALGVLNACLWLTFFLIYQAASVASNIWLSVWTEDPTLQNASLVNTSLYAQERDMYLGVYGGIGAGQAFFVLLYSIITAISMVRASGIMHERMLYNVLRSPMSFFDTTPIGRILNRFSRDIETIDNILPNLIRSWMNTFFTVLSTIIVISYSTPIFLVVVLPLGLFYYFIQRFYIPTSRQLKRVESTSRSPIYVHFSETITGASTIRAYNVQDKFITQSEDKVDHNLIFYFASIASNRWLGFRLEFVGALIVFAAAMFAVISRDSGINPGIVGLSISYALQVTQSLNWMVRMTSDLESNVVSVERVKEYSETPQEADWAIAETKPRRDWPDQGQVQIQEYETRYREGLDLVIKGVSADIAGGEKIGIVGRTGAGKSSLTLALFRIIEATKGKILIDGLDISTLGLHQLRSKLTILPQDPVLFSGSLRMNLDPFDKFMDSELFKALALAHLKEFIDSLPQGLDYECGEGGVNLSVGQRQLVCLARTLLRKTKILVLDEATAAVDYETDELIQKTIQREFADCTCITIAHRLNTIMDADRVMVLDAGKIAEFDNPQTLLDKKTSIFYGMAKDAGLA